MSGPAVISVLLVDDEPLLRSGLRLILESRPGVEVVAEAADGLDAVAEAARTRPDVVLMDIRMPRLDGIEATRRILADVARSGSGPPRVLILTTFDLDEYVVQALRAGASGFLLKDATRDQLLHAIRTVARGEELLAPSVTRRLIADYVRPRPPSSPAPELRTLTAREREVLQVLARGLTNAEIARELVVSEATVKTHVAHLLMKLGLRDRVQAVVFAFEHGLAGPGRDG